MVGQGDFLFIVLLKELSENGGPTDLLSIVSIKDFTLLGSSDQFPQSQFLFIVLLKELIGNGDPTDLLPTVSIKEPRT
jgi:hypothetical protein